MDEGRWTPSIIDRACERMVISASWVYRIHIEKQRMQDALMHLASLYPILRGRFDGKAIIFPVSDILLEFSKEDGSVRNLIGADSPPMKYEAGFSLNGMLRGTSPLISIRLTDLDDGCVLSLKASHLFMDGFCFYRIANTLMKLYSGYDAEPDIVFDDSVIPQIKLPDALDASRFYPIPKSALLSVISRKIHKPRMKTIFISNDRIREIKGRTSASRTAVLSAMVYGIVGNRAISIVQTASHRGHSKSIPSDYGGNAASTLPPIPLDAYLPIDEAARLLNEGIRRCLKDYDGYLPQYLFLMKEKLPYLPFPLRKAWKRNPDCIICNSFVSFGIYEEMAADGTIPAYAFPPDLPDPVRFFPAPPEMDGIYVFMKF